MATAAYLKPHKASLKQAEQLLLLYTAVGLSTEASDHVPLLGGQSQDCVELQAEEMSVYNDMQCSKTM